MIKLYIDYLSQPSRAVLALTKLAKLNVEVIEMRIKDQQLSSQEYETINPFRKVPAIADQDFKLQESHAIMKYLIKSKNVRHDLYPFNDHQKSAKIDSYLDWHHTHTRKTSSWVFNQEFAQILGKEIEGNIEEHKTKTLSALLQINNIYLNNQNYIANNSFSIADISAYSELKQLEFLNFDFSQFQNINKWMKHIGEIQEIKDAHVVFDKLVKIFHQKKAKNSDYKNLYYQ